MKGKLRPGDAGELTLKMYMLCTTTGIWRPRLLAKAWKGAEIHRQLSHTHFWPILPPRPLPSANLHLGRVCDTLEDRVMGVQSCRTEVG